MEKDLDNFIRQMTNLPPAPQILTKLIHLNNNMDTSIADVVAILNLDTSLTATVVRLSNSAYYGASVACTSADEAVSRVGFKEICKLIGMIKVQELFKMPLTTYRLRPAELWKTSICCAITMECIAQRYCADIRSAYTLGLLHGVGKLAINQYLATLKDPISFAPTDNAEALIEWEREQIGYDYAQVGAKLLHIWNFPIGVHDPIRHQLTPLVTPEDKRTACLLYVSIRAASHFSTNGTSDKDFASVPDEILGEIGIDMEELADCLPDVRQGFREILKLLNST